MTETTATKRCNHCGEIKSLGEFWKNKSKPDGREGYCKTCAKQFYGKYGDKIRKRVRRYASCVKNPACPAVGSNGAEFMYFTCEVCGREFRRRKSALDWNYENFGYLPKFCSRACYHASARKDYISPYARKIERIKKEVGA